MRPETILINIAQLEFNQATEMSLGFSKKLGTWNTHSKISDERFKSGCVIGQHCM